MALAFGVGVRQFLDLLPALQHLVQEGNQQLLVDLRAEELSDFYLPRVKSRGRASAFSRLP